MFGKQKPLRLGNLELGILEHLWRHGAASVKDVHDILGTKRGNTLNTVQSTLDRLFKKELLTRQKSGRSFYYVAQVSREDVLERKFNDLATELAGGEINSLFAAFVQFTTRLDASKLKELESLIAEYRKKEPSS